MRRAAVAVLIVAFVSLGAVPAAAGGSWLEGPDHVAVGDAITLAGDFGNGQLAPVSAGPWYAYLDVSSGGGEPADPLLLGHVEIGPGGFQWRASTTFTVPDVPAGDYWVNVCDLGCHTGVGDLIGAQIWIGGTVMEAVLLQRVSRLHGRLDNVRGRLDRRTAERDGLDRQLAAEQGELDVTRREMDVLAGRHAATLDSLDEQRQRAEDLILLTIMYVIVALVAVTALAWVTRRPRERRLYATRTLVTGARYPLTGNHDAPASPEPKTVPLVAPK